MNSKFVYQNKKTNRYISSNNFIAHVKNENWYKIDEWKEKKSRSKIF